MKPELPRDAIQILIGEQAVLLYGLLTFAYLNEDGEERVGYIPLEDPGIQQVLGMMTMALHALAQDGVQKAEN